jgi:hypothetical protein
MSEQLRRCRRISLHASAGFADTIGALLPACAPGRRAVTALGPGGCSVGHVVFSISRFPFWRWRAAGRLSAVAVDPQNETTQLSPPASVCPAAIGHLSAAYIVDPHLILTFATCGTDSPVAGNRLDHHNLCLNALLRAPSAR